MSLFEARRGEFVNVHYHIMAWILELQRDKRAVTTVEYGLVAALVAITIIHSLLQVGHSVQNTFSRISSEL